MTNYCTIKVPPELHDKIKTICENEHRTIINQLWYWVGSTPRTRAHTQKPPPPPDDTGPEDLLPENIRKVCTNLIEINGGKTYDQMDGAWKEACIRAGVVDDRTMRKYHKHVRTLQKKQGGSPDR